MIVRNSPSVRGEVLMKERPMEEAQKGEQPMEEVPTAKALTEQVPMEEPMEEVTAPLRWAHAIFKYSEPSGLMYRCSYNYM